MKIKSLSLGLISSAIAISLSLQICAMDSWNLFASCTPTCCPKKVYSQDEKALLTKTLTDDTIGSPFPHQMTDKDAYLPLNSEEDQAKTTPRGQLNLGDLSTPSSSPTSYASTPTSSTRPPKEILQERGEYLSDEIRNLLAKEDNCAKALSKAINAIEDVTAKVEIIDASKTKNTFRLKISGERSKKLVTWK